VISRSSQLLQALVQGGRIQTDAMRARKFMLHALEPVLSTFPVEARNAIDVARRSVRAQVEDDDLLGASDTCWKAMRSKNCDIPHVLGYAYRAAIGTCATQAQSEDPWTALDFFILCAQHSGVPDEHLEEALVKSYGPAT